MIIARQYVLMDYDIPDELVEKAVAITPGFESPTVSPLHNKGWSAVRSMVERKRTNQLMDELWDPRRPRHSRDGHPRMPTVTARPHLTARIAWAASALVLVVFVATALLMKRYNAGASFTDKDQAGTVVVGVVLALLLIMPTYPRLVADEQSVRIRSFLGNYRTIPWSSSSTCASRPRCASRSWCCRGRRPSRSTPCSGWDKERAVEAMDGLRALVRGDPSGRAGSVDSQAIGAICAG